MAPPSGPAYPVSGKRTLESPECEGMECEGCENYNECGGDMPSGPPQPSEQPSNISMNVSLNGSGTKGVTDLMDILKNAGIATPDSKKAVVIGGEMDEANSDDELWANSSDHAETSDIQAVLPTGNDLSSNLGDSRPRKLDLPRARIAEQLKQKLTNHYSSIKNR